MVLCHNYANLTGVLYLFYSKEDRPTFREIIEMLRKFK